MTRRNFLKFVAITLGTTATPEIVAKVAARFTQEEADHLMDYPEKAAKTLHKTFEELLAEYMPVELMREEILKRDHLLKKLEGTKTFKGGTLRVPLRG